MILARCHRIGNESTNQWMARLVFVDSMLFVDAKNALLITGREILLVEGP